MESSREPEGPKKRILLTGATGFVGQHLWPALHAAGHDVRCLSRDAQEAAHKMPERQWIQGDLSRAEDLRRVLEGVDVVYYLAHDMAEGGKDFRKHEIESARHFAEAARDAHVSRIIYLGGPAPKGKPSEHLKSRLQVGETLRAGAVPTLELRASMIIGRESLSWIIVRDLAARLPAMLLPRWLRARTQPVAVDDVVTALLRGIQVPLEKSAWYDIPGPNTLTGRAILERTADALGLRPPFIIEVPVLTPRLSSHWVHLVSSAKWEVAREVVLGLGNDIVADSSEYWSLIDHRKLIGFDDAARRAVAVEREEGKPVKGPWGFVERWIARSRPASGHSQRTSQHPRTA